MAEVKKSKPSMKTTSGCDVIVQACHVRIVVAGSRSRIGLRDVLLIPGIRSLKPAGSVAWCAQDLGSIKGHYR
jgi:hypothetical protein